MGENVGLPGVGNIASPVKRAALEFEIPTPPVAVLHFGKSRPMSIAAPNKSVSKNKADIY